jgi:hypothetical protein
VGRAEQEGNIAHGFLSQDGQSFRFDPEDFLTIEISNVYMVFSQEAVLGFVLSEREWFLVFKF